MDYHCVFLSIFSVLSLNTSFLWMHVLSIVFIWFLRSTTLLWLFCVYFVYYWSVHYYSYSIPNPNGQILLLLSFSISLYLNLSDNKILVYNGLRYHTTLHILIHTGKSIFFLAHLKWNLFCITTDTIRVTCPFCCLFLYSHLTTSLLNINLRIFFSCWSLV